MDCRAVGPASVCFMCESPISPPGHLCPGNTRNVLCRLSGIRTWLQQNKTGWCQGGPQKSCVDLPLSSVKAVKMTAPMPSCAEKSVYGVPGVLGRQRRRKEKRCSGLPFMWTRKRRMCIFIHVVSTGKRAAQMHCKWAQSWLVTRYCMPPPWQFQPMSNAFKQVGNVTQGQRVLDVCVCVCDLYYLRGRSICSHEMAGVFGSVCCRLFAPVIHPFCGIRTSVCVRLGNLGAGPSVCPQKKLAADCFRIRRLCQPLWNRGWWGGRGWRFGPPPLGGGRRWGLVWRPQRGLTCL